MAGFFNGGKKPVLRGDVIGGRHDSSDVSTVRLLRYRPITNFFSAVPEMTSATTGSDVNSDVDVTGKGEEESPSSDSKDDSRMGKCQVCLERRHSSKSGHKLPAAVIGRRCSFPRRRGSENSEMPATTKMECDTSSVVSGASDVSSIRSSDTLYRHGTDEADIDSDSTTSSDPIRLHPLPENINNRMSTCSTASRDLVKIRVFSKYKKTRDGAADDPAEPYEKKVSKGRRLGFDLSDEEEDDDDEEDDYYYCDCHHCEAAGGLEGASGGCKVCHHTDCQDRNNHRPIMLCSDCDSAIHQEGGDNTGHLRFDLYKKGSTLVRNQSTRSLPGVTSQSAEGSEEDDDDDDTTGSEAPATPTYDHVSTSSTASDVIINNDESKKNQKLRRKKVVKPRRCVTDRTRMRKQRSQYSLGMEYFTLKFDCLGEQDIEIVAAIKGTSLRDAIKGACERRGLRRMDSVAIYIASSSTPLPLTVDCFPLGGNNLHVRAKDGEFTIPKTQPGSTNPPAVRPRPAQQRPPGNQRPQYERQISQRSKKAADDTSLGDTSPYGTLTDQSQRSRPKSHNKISTFFSPFARQLGEKQEQLNDLLNSYSLNMPAMPELLTIGQGAYEPEIYDIENHWTDIVDNTESMTKKEKEQQMRLWELLRTEVEYIKRLKVITDLFMCCLLNLQNEMLLNEIETERVVSNIMEVHKVNCAFWEQHMSQVITHSRETRTPLDPSLMLEGFQRFEELFTPYTKYCLEQEGCQEYIKNKYRDNELFKTFVIWAEAQNQCNRLKLADLVVTPMQRLTRYKLLLSAILKETQEDSHRESLREMIEHVEKFVNQVNSVMHQRQEQARLSTIIDRIESYDVIDPPNDESARLVSEFCRLDLTCPVPGCGPKQRRHLLREGTLKMKETTNKMDVFCFLFTDMFLVTKANRRSQDKDKVKVIKPPMRLDKIVVHTLRDGVSFLLVYLNEYHMASAVYTFLGDAKPWVDAIRKAQDDYKAMRQTSLQRPESRLMYYDPSEDNEEEYTAVFNNMARSEYSPESTFSRLDSTGSVDGFLPTLSAPYPGSDGQPEYGDDDDRLKRLRSTNIHHGGSADSGASSRPRSPRLQSIPVRRTTSGDSSSIQEECPEGGTYLTISSDRRGLNHHQSSPATPESSRGDDGCPPYVPLSRRPQSACVRTDSGSSGEAGGYAGGPQKGFFAGQRSHELLGTSEESYKARLNQRRRIGEKRYHTADAIREIGKDRDSAIHKRLSWNFPVNINLEENKPSILKQKTFSSDSLRSVPSSSGVSSTGSLHMSPDTELAEGYESESTTGSTISSKRLSQIELRQGTSPNYHEPGRDDSVHRLVAGTMDNPDTTTITTAKGASVEEDTAALGQSNQMSKSMPDISNLSSPGDEDSHHGSNHGSPRQGQRRKMTHAQLQRIKKMMLLNSTLEASEV